MSAKGDTGGLGAKSVKGRKPEDFAQGPSLVNVEAQQGNNGDWQASHMLRKMKEEMTQLYCRYDANVFCVSMLVYQNRG